MRRVSPSAAANAVGCAAVPAEPQAVRRRRMSLGRWSMGRVGVIVLAWLVAVFFVSFYLAVRSLPDLGRGGISAVSFGIGETLFPAIVPAFAFVAAWLIERRRESAKP